MKDRPVAVMGAIITALQIINGGLGALDIIPDKWVAFIALIIAAITAGWAFYTHNQVTPLSDPKTKDGTPLIPAE